MPVNPKPCLLSPGGDGWERFTDSLSEGLGIIVADIKDWSDRLPLSSKTIIAERQLASFLLNEVSCRLRTVVDGKCNRAVISLPVRDIYGRPGVVGGDINLTHSGGKVAVIASLRHRVGIDIEPCSRELAEKSFYAWSRDEERNWIDTVTPAERPMSVVQLWTAKEAYAKAIGLGLHFPFRSILVKPGWPYGYVGWAKNIYGQESLKDLVTWSDIIPGFIISFIRISPGRSYLIKKFLSKNLPMGCSNYIEKAF